MTSTDANKQADNVIKISVVIPMYNENSIIEDTALTVHKYMTDRFGAGNFEILFSNDGSRDGCEKTVEALNLPGVIATGYKNNRGKGCAVRTASLQARGKYVVFTDADLAYGTEVIGRIYDIFESKKDCDMVIGSRNMSRDGYEGYTFLRKIASKTYIKVLCMCGGFRLSDSQCGCKAFTGEAAHKIFSRCEVDGFAFDFETILWAQKFGMKIKEMPVKIINHRESKVRLIRDTLKMLSDLRKMKKRIRKQSI